MLEIHCQRVSGSWRFLFIHFPLRGMLWIQIIFKIICEHALWLLLLFLFFVDWHCSNVKLLFKVYGVFHRPNPRMVHRACPQLAHWSCFLLSRAPDSAPATHFQGYLNIITFISVSSVQTILEAGFLYSVKSRMLCLVASIFISYLPGQSELLMGWCQWVHQRLYKPPSAYEFDVSHDLFPLLIS